MIWFFVLIPFLHFNAYSVLVQIDVPVYAEGVDVKPAEIAKHGLEEAKKKSINVVIVDTAGRLQVIKAYLCHVANVHDASLFFIHDNGSNCFSVSLYKYQRVVGY